MPNTHIMIYEKIQEREIYELKYSYNYNIINN